MKGKLRLYTDKYSHNEYVAIEVDYLEDDEDLELIAEIDIDGDLVAFPTDRLLIQEQIMNCEEYSDGLCKLSQGECGDDCPVPFVNSEEEMCYDCRVDRDYCCDCDRGDLYLSPDSYYEEGR